METAAERASKSKFLPVTRHALTHVLANEGKFKGPDRDDLITFSERIPPTWKPYFKLAIGDPDDAEDRRDLEERSPNAPTEMTLGPEGRPVGLIQVREDDSATALHQGLGRLLIARMQRIADSHR